MRISFLFLCIMVTHYAIAQDYYYIKNDASNTSYNYPSNIQMTLNNGANLLEVLDKETPFYVTAGDVLTVETPWGIQETFRPLENHRIEVGRVERSTYSVWEPNTHTSNAVLEKPALLSRIVEKSTIRENLYNLSLSFSDGLFVSIQEGKLTATKDGLPLVVDGKYLIRSEKYTFKLSFDQSDGELWFVFAK